MLFCFFKLSSKKYIGIWQHIVQIDWRPNGHREALYEKTKCLHRNHKVLLPHIFFCRPLTTSQHSCAMPRIGDFGFYLIATRFSLTKMSESALNLTCYVPHGSAQSSLACKNLYPKYTSNSLPSDRCQYFTGVLTVFKHFQAVHILAYLATILVDDVPIQNP